MTHTFVLLSGCWPLAAMEISPALVAGAVLGGLVMVGLAAIPVLRKIVEKQRRDSHPALFRRLVALHELSRRERQWVSKLVREKKPSPPGRIFVESIWLDRALQAGPPEDEAELLTQLRDRLFSMEDDEAPASAEEETASAS